MAELQWLMWALLLLIVVMAITSWVPFLYIKETRRYLEQKALFSKLIEEMKRIAGSSIQTSLEVEDKELPQKPTEVVIRSGQTGALDRLGQLLTAVNEVNGSIDKLKEAVEDLPRNLTQLNAENNKEFGTIVIEFREALQLYLEEWPKISQTIVEANQQFLNSFASQFDRLQNQIEVWVQTANQQAAQLNQASQQSQGTGTSTRPRPRTKSAPLIKPVQTETPEQSRYSSKPDQAEHSAVSSKPNQIEPAKQSNYSSNEDMQRFNEVREWVSLNIQRIMRQGIGEWSDPEEFLLDNPPYLELTVSILKDKVLLIGTNRYSQQLALGLPNRYMAEFYDWFSMPKGSDAEVKQTTDPAIVESIGNKFRVIHRGSLRQD